jgi:hypothetical protein
MLLIYYLNDYPKLQVIFLALVILVSALLFLRRKAIYSYLINDEKSLIKDILFMGIIYPYITLIFILRGIFVRYPKIFAYILSVTNALNMLYPNVFFTYISFKAYWMNLIGIGITFIAWDAIGDQIATLLQDKTRKSGYYGEYYMSLVNSAENSTNTFANAFSTMTWGGFIFGKNAMTSTGRATIIAGAVGGTGYLLAEYYNQVIFSRESALNRKSQMDAAKTAADSVVEAAKTAADSVVEAAKIAAETTKATAEVTKAAAELQYKQWHEYYDSHGRWSTSNWFTRGKPPVPPFSQSYSP